NGASAGGYVRFPLEAMLAVVAQESVGHRCVIIGEDLGTVPENLRETLADWGVWSYRVMLFERDEDGRFRPPDHYPEDALVTFSTHDLPNWRRRLPLALENLHHHPRIRALARVLRGAGRSAGTLPPKS